MLEEFIPKKSPEINWVSQKRFKRPLHFAVNAKHLETTLLTMKISDGFAIDERKRKTTEF